MLKSRALPDDFDTTKVLRTPFESKSTGQTPVASPHDYGVPNPDFAALRTLRTDCFQRPNEEDYLVSPLSSASTAGTYMSSAGQGRTDGLPQPSIMYGRPMASSSMSDLHRTIRSDYSITRSSSVSDASSQPPSFHPGMQLHNRFTPTSNQPGMPYGRQPMEYGVPRHPGTMMTGYDQSQSFEGSVSPTDSQGNQMPYELGSIGLSIFTPRKPRLKSNSWVTRHPTPKLPVPTSNVWNEFANATWETNALPAISTCLNATGIQTLPLRSSLGTYGHSSLYTIQLLNAEPPHLLRSIRTRSRCPRSHAAKPATSRFLPIQIQQPTLQLLELHPTIMR